MKSPIYIVLAQQKGGVGKSTIAVLTAVSLASPTFNVAIVDLDPQGTAMLWAAAGNGEFPVPVVPASAETLPAVLASLAHCDVVVLDCPLSAVAAETLAAIDVATLVVAPLSPSATDYWSAEAIFVSAQVRRPGVPVLAIVNGRARTNHATEMEANIRKSWPTAAATLSRRTAYQEAAAYGVGIRQLPGRPNPAAVAEIEALAIELLTTAMKAA